MHVMNLIKVAQKLCPSKLLLIGCDLSRFPSDLTGVHVHFGLYTVVIIEQ